MLIAKDRSSSFLMRLFSSPLTPSDYILGYTLPIMPISLAQSIICFVLALSLGLGFSTYVLATIAVLVPIGLLYVAVGLLLGILFTDKQVGGIFAIFVNLSAWLSGTWSI
jgi:ABC-2 type transport system permease protein